MAERVLANPGWLHEGTSSHSRSLHHRGHPREQPHTPGPARRLPEISQNSGPCLLFSPFRQVPGITSPRSQGQRSPLATLPQAKGLPAGSFPSIQVPVSSRHKGKEEQISARLAATPAKGHAFQHKRSPSSTFPCFQTTL